MKNNKNLFSFLLFSFLLCFGSIAKGDVLILDEMDTNKKTGVFFCTRDLDTSKAGIDTDNSSGEYILKALFYSLG